MTQKYGCIRVSSKDQNLWRQIDAMVAQGIREENIFTDKITGGTFVRPGYEALLKKLKKKIFYLFMESTNWAEIMTKL